MVEPAKPSPNARLYPRVSVATPAEVRISKPGLTVTGQLMDISEGGMGIITAGVTLTVVEVVSVELLVDSPDKPASVRAMVCYSRGARHGLQFLPEQETKPKV